MPNISQSDIHTDAIIARHISPGAVGTDAIADDSVNADKLAEDSVYSPSIAPVANNNVGQLVTVHIAIPDAAGDVDVVLPFKAEVVGVQAWKRGGAGGAGDTVTIKNGATAITNAISLNITDNAPANASSLDDASSTIAAGGTLRATAAKASDCEALVLVQMLKRP